MGARKVREQLVPKGKNSADTDFSSMWQSFVTVIATLVQYVIRKTATLLFCLVCVTQSYKNSDDYS